MKLRFLLILMLLGSIGGHAQSVVNGFMTNSNGQPEPSIWVNVRIFSLSPFSNVASDSVVTDSSGFFTTTFSNLGAGPYYAYLSYYDCGGNYIVDSAQVANPGVTSFNLLYCSNTPQCNAAFTYTQNGQGTFAFYDSSYVVGNNVQYFWSFGDGSTASGLNVNHTYQQSGTYQVCLNVVDSLSGCFDSHCRNVFYAGGGGPTNCDASFGFAPDSVSPNTFYFYPLTNLPLTTNYFWDFGDGNTSTQQSPTHTYNSSGWYHVSLMIADSANQCQASSFDTVTVQGGLGCVAAFTFNIGSAGSVNFFSQSNGAAPISHFWNFGDGNTSTQSSPIHTYLASGTYNVSLLTTDNTGCMDTVAASVTVQVPQPGNAVIQGSVYLPDSSLLINNAVAYLVVMDTVNGQLALNAIDTTSVNQNFYAFNNVFPGNYMVKVALLPASAYYTDHLPTYHFSSLNWSAANNISVNLTNVWAPVFMQAGVNPGGPGFIGGLVSQGANKTAGAPLDNIQVNLLDENDLPIAYAMTDGNGEYGFDNLPYGTYKVYVEIIGVPAETFTVSIDADNPSTDATDFEVTLDGVNIVTSNSDLMGQQLSIFPNPVSNQLGVEIESTSTDRMEISILDVQGKELMRHDVSVRVGKQLISLPVDNLQKGIFLLQVKQGDKIFLEKFVKE
ncbi:MAG: PKD domain-containing protein [Bacteroidota bacterium]